MGLLDGVEVSSQERQETKKPKSRRRTANQSSLPPSPGFLALSVTRGLNAQNPFQKIWFLTADNTHDNTFSQRLRWKTNPVVVFSWFFFYA